jgi:hypothetical protein
MAFANGSGYGYSYAGYSDEDAMGPRQAVSAYGMLKQKALKIDADNHAKGWAYVISGAVTLGVCIPGYYLSKDLLTQGIYGFGQTAGVIAVTYGSSLVLVSNDYARFYHILNGTPGLSGANREQLSRLFLQDSATQSANGRKIKAIGASLNAALQFSNALTTSNQDLRTAYFFVGGISTLAAIGLLVSTTEEEKLSHSLETGETPSSSRHHFSVQPVLGPVLGLQIGW